jgi:hypothetical protein
VRNTETGWTTSKGVWTALSAKEEGVVLDLKLMEKLTVWKTNMATVMKALETLSKFEDKGMVR